MNEFSFESKDKNEVLANVIANHDLSAEAQRMIYSALGNDLVKSKTINIQNKIKEEKRKMSAGEFAGKELELNLND